MVKLKNSMGYVFFGIFVLEIMFSILHYMAPNGVSRNFKY